MRNSLVRSLSVPLLLLALALPACQTDEIMRDGEISEATALAWDVLDEMAAQQPAPFTPTIHHQPQAGL